MHSTGTILRKAQTATAILVTMASLASCSTGTTQSSADDFSSEAQAGVQDNDDKILTDAAPGRRQSRLSTAEQPRPLPQVGVMRVEPSSDVSMRSYVGTVTASRSVRLSAKYSGRIESLHAFEGRRIEAGQTIAIVSSETVQSALKTAQATFDYAKDGLDRAEKVYASGTVTEQKMVEIRSEFAKAEATLAAARQALEECTIRAPFAGIIGSVGVCEGENVNALQTVATLLDISAPEIEISVPEAEMPLIKTGESMNVRVPALGGASFRAVVRVKGVTASPISHSYTCTLAPISRIDGLLPGMVCNVTISDQSAPLVVIPPQTVRTDASGRYVWTVREGRVEKSRVTVGGYSGNSLAITDGLLPGDLLIVEGTQRVSSGMRVEVREIDPE